jgi:phage protein D
VSDSFASQPRGIVKVNGTPIVGWTGWSVTNTNNSTPDTFRCEFAGVILPIDRDTQWFSQQKDMYVELFGGFPSNLKSFGATDLKSFIYGQVDHIDYDPDQDILSVEGRDLTRVFIDTKSTQKYPNLTSSQIITQLAKSHGLNAVVTATKTQTGKYYEIDHVNMTDERTEWELMNYLAGAEGFLVFVRGQTVYFQPPTTIDTGTPYMLTKTITDIQGPPVTNWESLKLSRALTVSRGINVIVRSWNSKQQKGFTAYYPNKQSGVKVGGSSAPQTYSRTFPNLTQDQAQKKAESLYQAIVQHEMRLQVEMPADTVLDTTSLIQLTGTGTDWDQTYYPDAITRNFDWNGGFDMSVMAKNHSPDSEIGAI